MPTQEPHLFRKISIILAIFIVYILVAIITTWPLITHLTTHLPGGSDDTFLHYWNSWWVKQALSSGQSPFYTPYLFYPNGISLVTHNIAWFNILPWLLLEPLVGGVVAYNLVILLNFALCGCSLFWLSYKLTDNFYAAFLAALIYQAWPYRLSQLDHPNLIATYWIPIFFFFLIYTIRQARWRDSLLTGVSFALIGYSRWQLLIPVTIMALIYFFYTVPSWWAIRRRLILFRLILAASIAIATLLPAIFLLNQEINNDNSANLLHQDPEEWFMQSDLLAYMTPGQSHPLFKSQSKKLYERYYSDRDVGLRYTLYIGLVAFCLALLGIYAKRRESVPWVLMAIILILLALGPLLRVNGQFYEEVPTFYGALSFTYVIRLMRVPDRFNMFLALPISVLAAYGVTVLLSHPRWNKPRSTLLISTVLATFILLEYVEIPHSLIDVSSPLSFEKQLVEQPSDFAVLNLPIDKARSKLYMFYQMTHQHPILQGHISRQPNEIYGYMDSNPLLRSWRKKSEISPELTDVSRQLADLANEEIRYIIMHKWFDWGNKLSHWRRYLLIEPYYEDERVVVYQTLQKESNFSLIEEMVPGLGPIKTIVSSDCLNPNGVLEVDVGWGSTKPLAQEFDVVISLVDRANIVQQSEHFALSPNWPIREWPAHSVAWGYYMLSLSPLLPVGEYMIRLTLLDTQTGESHGNYQIDSITVQSEICNLATKPEAKDLNALYGNQLRLLEYESKREEDELNLTFYWRAEQRMETNYTMFVHVFDFSTGYPVAQEDGRPQDGFYLTPYWWPTETVVDQVSISLHEVPAGNYGIAIGVYDSSTVENLPVLTSQGQLIEDGRLILDEMVEVK